MAQSIILIASILVAVYGITECSAYRIEKNNTIIFREKMINIIDKCNEDITLLSYYNDKKLIKFINNTLITLQTVYNSNNETYTEDDIIGLEMLNLVYDTTVLFITQRILETKMEITLAKLYADLMNTTDNEYNICYPTDHNFCNIYDNLNFS